MNTYKCRNKITLIIKINVQLSYKIVQELTEEIFLYNIRCVIFLKFVNLLNIIKSS